MKRIRPRVFPFFLVDVHGGVCDVWYSYLDEISVPNKKMHAYNRAKSGKMVHPLTVAGDFER